MPSTHLTPRGPSDAELEQAIQYIERCKRDREAVMHDDEYIAMKMNERLSGDYTVTKRDDDPGLYLAAAVAVVLVIIMWGLL